MKILYLILMLTVFLSTISYADDSSTNDTKLILNELREIRASLNRIADELAEARAEIEKQKSLQPLSTDINPFDNSQGPDINKLADLTISDNAGPDEIKRYILSIIAASQGQNTFSDRDPQVAMLTKVGKKNLPMLIDAISFSRSMNHNYHIERAIINLADESNKSLILKSLPVHHDLVRAVIQKGWESDARDILFAELKNPGQYLPTEWIRAVANLNDRESYPLLRDYFINGTNRAWTYKTIQHLPIENMPEAVEEAWNRSKYEHGYNRISMATIAIGYGNLDALEALVNSLTSETHDSYWVNQDARPAVLQYTNFTGSNAELKDWFQNNRSFLRFDPEQKKFVIGRK